jgi:hypothetical protein
MQHFVSFNIYFLIFVYSSLTFLISFQGYGFVRFAERECAYIAKRQINGFEARISNFLFDVIIFFILHIIYTYVQKLSNPLF